MPEPLLFTPGLWTPAQWQPGTGVVMVLIGAGLFATVMLVILILISRSIRTLNQGAQRFAQGDLSRRVEVTGPLQLAGLAESLNQMAGQLNVRLSTVVQQRNELGALLSSMVEGVVAVNREQRILSLNRAASEMLQLDPRQTIGRSIQEVIRNSTMQELVRRSLNEDAPVQGELTLQVNGNGNDQHTQDQQRHIEFQSAQLHDARDKRIGMVIVLHDVTQLRKLESVRRDFVANVSHEVKTPVSAIKASVETLLDDQTHDPQQIHHFMKIIQRQADRLAAIVEDLLSLARIEQDTATIYADLETAELLPVLAAACETCQAGADARRMQLHLTCPPDLHARINPPLLEQAVVNLVDNAIKYSPEGKPVYIEAHAQDREVVVIVRDEGRGIEPAHLPRIFERFYRTDRARSRQMGGTGLGLSIVKHIAQAHGGRVSVDSRIGVGSRFTIHLQAPPPVHPAG